jgi:hypothetical protein
MTLNEGDVEEEEEEPEVEEDEDARLDEGLSDEVDEAVARVTNCCKDFPRVGPKI